MTSSFIHKNGNNLIQGFDTCVVAVSFKSVALPTICISRMAESFFSKKHAKNPWSVMFQTSLILKYQSFQRQKSISLSTQESLTQKVRISPVRFDNESENLSKFSLTFCIWSIMLRRPSKPAKTYHFEFRSQPNKDFGLPNLAFSELVATKHKTK